MASAYCTREDIEQVFGRTNVTKSADLDDNGNAEEIAARITAMIVAASNEVDDRLRGGPYRVPITQTCETIKFLTAHLAGVMLYEARGVQDFDTTTGLPYHRLHWHRTHVDTILTQIRSGVRRLDIETVERHTQSPSVVKDG